MTTSNYTVVVGTIVHSLSLGELQVIDRGAIVAKDGIIEKVVDLGSGGADALAKLTAELGSSVPVTDYGTKFIVPGFIDTHCHAPQYVFTGTGMDLPLLKWLEKYTFPCESKFQDIEHAKQAYTRSVKAHLSSGSTFCSYFATIHTPAAMILADVCTELGQRAFIGKVSMDRNSPDFYVESTEQGCEDAELFARKLLEVKGGARGAEFLKEVDTSGDAGSPNTQPALLNRTDTPLVVPAITPRFVPTCTEAMMRELGRIAGKYALPIQSHLSENMEECQWVASLHPDIQGYGTVYDEMGLLNEVSYMAHCVYSDEQERKLMKDRGCGVCHCASSNFSLCSGVMDIRQFLDEGLKVGLGTDVAGGYSASMLDAIRQSITASTVSSFRRRDKLLSEGKEKDGPGSFAPLSYQEAFHLATLGGAEVLSMEKVVGNFIAGKRLDCLVVDLDVEGTRVDLFGFEDVSEKFQKFLYLADDRNITHIYVDGKMVKGAKE